jgi:hypothetical protein
MRVYTNENTVRSKRREASIFFFVAIGVSVVSFVTMITQPAEQQMETMWFTMIILIIGVWAVIRAARLSNVWLREPRPAEVLEEGLKRLGNNYALFNYLLPAHHVLVTPRGVFAFAVMYQRGKFIFKGSQWQAPATLLARVLRFLRQETTGQPIDLANRDALRAQLWLDMTLPEDVEIEVEPLLVFTDPAATFEAEEPSVPVLYADSKRKPNLVNYITEQMKRDDRPVLDKSLRQAIEDAATASGK